MCQGGVISVDLDSFLDALARYERLGAELHRVAGEIDAAALWEIDGATSMTAWLKDKGRMSAASAGAMTRTAARLRHLPVTGAAWAEGSLSGDQVRAVAAIVPPHAVEQLAAEEPGLVPLLADLTVAQTATVMRRWRSFVDEPLQEEPERHVHLSETMGRHELSGSLDAEGGAVVAAALRVADRGDREKPLSVRQADALVDVCRFFLDNQDAATGGRNRPHVSVIVDLETFTGRVLDGMELSGADVRRILCDAGVSRVVTAGASGVIDVGTTTRTVPQHLFAALAVRDGGCRFPGCDRRTSWCDAHHVRHWKDGGPTSMANLVLLCSRHHHTVHARGWSARLRPDATFEVGTADGRTLTGRPPPEPARLLAA
jgi:hypothetical protein